MTKFGVHYMPIFPLGFVNTNEQNANDGSNGARINIKTVGGYNFGGNIRFGLSDLIGLETGINLVMRRYKLELTSPDYNTASSTQKFRGYELPINCLVFIKLGDNMFMNASGGLSFDFYPTGGVATYDRDTIEFGLLESNWIQMGLNAGLGWEYRTLKSGTFYFGLYYHLPFDNIATLYVSDVPYTDEDDRLIDPPAELRGSYLTLDFRYYFHSNKKKEKKKE